ncbi:hypothetical protein JCGZ_22475 [Jatropha curcas]|uniref:Uncharacterized protein n=1 Tax=Jatropha curcas TaxID=180498 RepID=A0A067K386_JATCU|nr:UPF0481 protein At3g47200 [Jatropha curcas]KDP26229.1 hypothetical protein JCGZ_22475 [Jatropha curcas]
MASIDAELETLRNLVQNKKLENQGASSSRNPRIGKVPLMLQGHKDYERYFNPRGVAIGPILHGRNNKYAPAEKLKQRLAAEFIRDSGKKMDDLYEKIKVNVESLKNCYDKEIIKEYNNDDDDKKIAWILFVDGCAVLQFINSLVEGNLKKLRIKNDLAAFATQDLLLLENQIPFDVLELLMSETKNGNKFWLSILRFIHKNMGLVSSNTDSVSDETLAREAKEIPKPIHLLDLLRTRLLCLHRTNDRRIDMPNSTKNISCPGRFFGLTGTGNVKKDQDKEWNTFRNISELKSAGIRVKRSTISCFRTGIDFTSGFLRGTLRLPPIRVDDSTGPILMNLVAYEMCPDYANEFEITSYVCLLDSLIDHPEDVKELRKANILHNMLGSDEQVAKLFNEISIDLVPNDEAYFRVKNDMQFHYDKKWKTWIAEGLHDHFGSPWTFLAFGGALLGLVFSAIQAWYSPKK